MQSNKTPQTTETTKPTLMEHVFLRLLMDVHVQARAHTYKYEKIGYHQWVGSNSS